MGKSKLHTVLFIPAFLLTFVLASGIAISEGADNKETKCKLEFSVKGWSAIYETASGTGTITCDNGQTARVKIDVKGGGLTAGKSSMKGTGTFSEVSDIQEIFGTYAKAEAHAGMVKSAGAQVMTKGEVSLAITAKGKGVDLGIAFGKFSIDRIDEKSGK
jgi:hypothetical protein